MELEVFKINGNKAARKVKLDDAIFGIKPNDHAIYLDVKQYLAHQRQGTHSSKERSMLSGSRRKIKKQKGTGSARAGDIKSPIFRGGAKTFGPHPRDYRFKLNKKLKRLARKSALSYKAQDNELMVIEDFSFEAPRTKDYVEILSHFDLVNKKTLLILNQPSQNVYLSTCNLKNAKVCNVTDLNTYDILNANNLLFVESSIAEMDKLYNK